MLGENKGFLKAMYSSTVHDDVRTPIGRDCTVTGSLISGVNSVHWSMLASTNDNVNDSHDSQHYHCRCEMLHQNVTVGRALSATVSNRPPEI
jgi:hypothetical protein